MKNKLTKVLILLSFLLAGCGAEQFSVKKNREESSSNPVVQSSTSSCGAFTLVKPKVDFLFLWDNSTSTNFINPDTKSALNNTINLISSRFDYHILMAPLMGSGLNEASFFSETPDGLGSSALAIKKDKTFASNYLAFSPSNNERGVQRTLDIIKSNVSNGIFRPNSYLVVVIMSNEDDTSWQLSYPVVDRERSTYVDQKLHELLCLRGNYTPPPGKTCNGTGVSLNSAQLRFTSISAHNPKNTSCSGLTFWEQNQVYKEISSRVYSAPYTNGVQLYDQSLRSDLVYDAFLKITNYDSYNICNSSSYGSIFDGINASIQDTLIKHEYDYWPVATAGASFNQDKISVFKNGQEITQLSEPVTSPSANGFTFTNQVYVNTNTRYAPSPGEPFTGYMVKLYGDARVKYPECLSVTTESPKEYFGYVNLQSKPLESSIVLKINGQVVPQSSTNGWQLLKSGGQPQFFNSKNIKIQSPGSFCGGTNYCEGSPAINKSGYFIQLFGTAVYSNGATVEIEYDPSS